MTKRILVIEDNELNLKLFCDLLRAHGHETRAVRDGRDAVAIARDMRPDLIITDIQLPFISGIELIESLRSDAALAHVPVMAVTAYSAPGDEERITAKGATAYVSKPIAVLQFMALVDRLLASAPANRAD